MKALREFYWTRIRRYDGEICQDCGNAVRHHTGSCWRTSEEVWNAVMGRATGILCPPCFTKRARAVGVRVLWEAMPEAEWDARWQHECGLFWGSPDGTA
jgi:hypothetical protein